MRLSVRRVVLIFAILAAVPLWRSILFQEVPFDNDLENFIHPQREVLYRALRESHLPLWNPYVVTGMPFVADLQSAVFYPPSLLYYALPPQYATPLVIYLHLIVAGVGAYLLLRRRFQLGHGRDSPDASLAALLGAIVYAFGGFLIVHHIHPCVAGGAALMPWALLALDGLSTTGSYRYAVWAGIAIGLQILAGHFQLAYYTGLFGGLYVLVLSWDAGPREGRWRRVVHRVAGVGAACVCATALSAIQLIPSLDLVSLGTRSREGVWEHASSFSLEPDVWIMALIPNVLGSGTGATFNGPYNYWEMTTYVGILPLLLALCAVAMRKETAGLARAVRPAVWLLVCGTLVALGRWGGLHYLLFRILPGYRLFRCPSRAAIFATLAVAWLAGACFLLLRDRLSDPVPSPQQRSRLATALLVLGILCAIAAPIVFPLTPLDHAERWHRILAVWRFSALAVAASLLLQRALAGRLLPRTFERAAFALVLLDLGAQWAPYIPMRPAAALRAGPPLARDIAGIVGSGRLFVYGERTPRVPRHETHWDNSGVRFRYRTVRGVKPMMLAHVYDTLTRDVPQPSFASPANPYFPTAPARLLGYGVSAVMVPVDYAGELPAGSTRVSDDGEFALYHVKAAPRARVVDGAGADSGTATLQVDREDEVELRACAGAGSARLVLYDADHPGWSATVDHQPVEIHREEGAFRSVALPPGCHDVRFSYKERGLVFGAWITLLSALSFSFVLARRGPAR